MRKQPVIQVQKLGKMYFVSGERQRYYTLRDTLTDLFFAPIKRAKGLLRGQNINASGPNQAFWALKKLSFEMEQGEVLGIIGHNGAGKSTLLKILSQITEPTEGRAIIRGRVGALLEVGTGFHPELTGRENIYLNGAILGMSKKEIERKFDEIVAFAEVERFIDTPVKHFSSGMGLRLGFSVAAHLEPEILIVDEVLAVGDARFQKKSLGRMSDIAQQGRTVLFVSHNMPAIQNMCTRVIWLNNGEIVADGASEEVVAQYLKASLETNSDRVWDNINTAPGNDKVRLRRIAATPEEVDNPDLITMRTPMQIVVEFWNLIPDAFLDITLIIYSAQGAIAFGTGTVTDSIWHGRPMPTGLYRSVCQIPGDLLNSGMHRVRLLIVQDSVRGIYQHDDIISFDVLDSADHRDGWYGPRVGAVRPLLMWSTQKLENQNHSVIDKNDQILTRR